MERLVIDSGVHTFAADFHPRLTVIGGLAPSAREALAGEVIDSLAGARPGVHLELESAGRHLTVFRPAGGRHRVVDTDAAADVTDRYVGADGSIDLFAALGVDRALARRTMRLTRDDLVSQGSGDEIVARLAAVDQDALWRAADRLVQTDEQLDRISEESGTSATDIALVDDVEAKHAALVEATKTYERTRLIGLTIGDIGAIAALSLSFTRGVAAGAPFLLLAIAGVLLGLYYRRRVAIATEAEREVLTAAGAEDYAAFHLERVNALLDGDQDRRRFMQAVTEHRHAADEWAEIAGDVPLAVALEHRASIQAGADVRTSVDSLDVLSSDVPDAAADRTHELAQALYSRIEGVRALTADDDVLPLVVDDPFEDVDVAVKPALLELMASAAGAPQLIVLTAAEDITSWARLEELSGRLAVVEPTVLPSTDQPSSVSA